MTLNDVELITATQQSVVGEPAVRPYTLTRVSRSVRLSVSLVQTLPRVISSIS